MPEDIEKNLSRAEAPHAEAEPVSRKEKPPSLESAVPKEAVPIVSTPPVAPLPRASEPASLAAPRDTITESLEMILSEDLGDFYRAMAPEERARFKAKGEETVSKIRQMLDGATIKAKEILMLIISWIKFVPGLNRFFLEQESKIKTDKILELHRRLRGD